MTAEPLPLCSETARRAEAELVLLAAAGEHDAFEALWFRYHKFVDGAAASLCRPHESFAPDVAQEVWVSLLDGQWRLRPNSRRETLHAFIYTVVRHLVWRMRQAAHPTVRFIPIGIGIASCLAAIHHDPVSHLLSAEQSTLLRWAVAALPQRDRAILRLRYAEGLSCRAIAERDGRAMQSVAEHLQRIHRKVSAACGVPQIRVGRGRYPRDVAGTAQYGLGSPRRQRLAGDGGPAVSA